MWQNQLCLPVGLLLVTALLADQVHSQEPPVTNQSNLRITVSPETTVLTKPLRDDGYIDYIAALNQIASKGVTPENNAAVLFVEALGPVCLGDMDPERFHQLLGIEPLPDQGEYFVPLNQYAATRSGEEAFKEQIEKAFDKAEERPWNEREFPEIAAWLRLNQQSLDLFCRGCQRPRYFAPMLGGADEGDAAILLDARLATLHPVRSSARSLTARAMLRLREGNLEAAWADLLACHRLARLVGQDPTLIGMLVSVAIERIACRGDAHLIASQALTAHQARSAVADLRALAPLPGLRRRINQAERFTVLDEMAAVASERVDLDQVLGGSGGPAFDTLANVGNTLVDWDLALQHASAWYDRADTALERPTYAERAAAFEQVENDLRDVGRELFSPRSQFGALVAGQFSRRVADLFVCLSLGATSACHVAEHHGIAIARLNLLGYALAAHHAEHGEYPKQPSQLVPHYLAELPMDPFTDASFSYRSENKEFLLYSFGANMKDDGGKNGDLDGHDLASDKESDDLGLRLSWK
jgi:hypothetical protein